MPSGTELQTPPNTTTWRQNGRAPSVNMRCYLMNGDETFEVRRDAIVALISFNTPPGEEPDPRGTHFFPTEQPINS
jgi:hypothetical protein